MKENEFLDGVSNIEPDVVERFISMDNKLKSKSKFSWLRFGVVAACFLLIVGVIIVVPMLSDEPDPYVPYFDPAIQPYFPTGDAWSPIINSDVGEVVLSANEVGKVFDRLYDSVGTNQYKRIYSPTTENLGITPLPNAEYLPIFSTSGKLPTQEEVYSFMSEYLDSTSALFDFDAEEIVEEELENGVPYYRVDSPETSDYIVFSGTNNSLYFTYVKLDGTPLGINGEQLSILESDTDEQIKEKLKNTLDRISSSFGKKYTDIKIIRGYQMHKFSSVRIYLYSPEETVLPPDFSDSPKTSDYISLTFFTDNDNINEAFLSDVSFYQAIENWNEYYKVDAKAKMITLQEAEELLKKGYVFGGHTCPLCMALQPEVDFSTYTCVEIEYLSDSKGERISPFYAFYKYIGQNGYGMNTFAKTYVPAIEVSGYEEYFESQQSNHKNYWNR